MKPVYHNQLPAMRGYLPFIMSILILSAIALVLVGVGFATDQYNTGTDFVSPLSTHPIPTPTPTHAPTTTPTPASTKTWQGKASWYGVSGCLGCSPTLTMANGQKLDDTKMTVAFNRAPLGTQLRITNLETGLVATATVSDTGGFERHGKIIDLVPAVRDAIGCGSVCEVEVQKI